MTTRIALEPVAADLQAFLAAQGGKPFGWAEVPPNPGTNYGILYPLGGLDDGAEFGAQSDLHSVWQVTYVGSTLQQAMWLADRVEAALFGQDADGAFTTPIALAGVLVAGREARGDGMADRSGTELATWARRYALDLTAA